MDQADKNFTAQVIKEFYIKELLELQAQFLKYKVLNVMDLLDQVRKTTAYRQNHETLREARDLINRQPRFNFKNDIIQSFKNENAILKL